MRKLRRLVNWSSSEPEPPALQVHRLRLMTYNVHGCVGRDGITSPQRIADVINACEADICAVQEVDVERRRTGGVHQPELLAERLSMRALFCCTLYTGAERYGHAVLSRYPVEVVAEGTLPSGYEGGKRLEPRGAMWVRVIVGGGELQILATHLGLSRRERRAQADWLTGPQWLGHPLWKGPRVVCGDLNALPRSWPYMRLAHSMVDVQTALPRHRARATWPMPRPMFRIDHMFVSREMHVRQVDVPMDPLIRVASDHAPLVAEVDLPDVHLVESDRETRPHDGA